MGKPITLATGTFATQAAAKKFFSEMLSDYRVGERIEPEDENHLASLLERHSEYAQKLGCGLAHFECMRSDYGDNCFKIVRLDGSSTHFSYITCISGKPSRRQEVHRALREEVKRDIWRARDAFLAANRDADGLVACGVTGERVKPDDTHLDHVPPLTFEVLVTTFLAAHQRSYDSVPLTEEADNQNIVRVTDASLVVAFRQFHADVAQIDVIKSTVNLAQATRNRIKPGRVFCKCA